MSVYDPVAQMHGHHLYLSAQERERLAREQRNTDALAYLHRKGHDDLAEILGLVDAGPGAKKPRAGWTRP